MAKVAEEAVAEEMRVVYYKQGLVLAATSCFPAANLVTDKFLNFCAKFNSEEYNGMNSLVTPLHYEFHFPGFCTHKW